MPMSTRINGVLVRAEVVDGIFEVTPSFAGVAIGNTVATSNARGNYSKVVALTSVMHDFLVSGAYFTDEDAYFPWLTREAEIG